MHDKLLRFFEYDHLPVRLQEVSKPFCKLATKVAEMAPLEEQTNVALQKMLEAKDAAVRAVLAQSPEQ